MAKRSRNIYHIFIYRKLFLERGHTLNPLSNDYWNKYAKNASLTSAKCSAELNNIYNSIEMIMTIALWEIQIGMFLTLNFQNPLGIYVTIVR